MQINSISNNSFNGKIKYDVNLSKVKKDFVEKILDYKNNGKTLRDRILRANYDVMVDTVDLENTIHPKIYFYSKFKKLKISNRYEEPEKYVYISKDLKIDSSIKSGAKHLEKFLDDFEKKKRNYFNICNSHNKIKERFEKFFGIKK